MTPKLFIFSTTKKNVLDQSILKIVYFILKTEALATSAIDTSSPYMAAQFCRSFLFNSMEYRVSIASDFAFKTKQHFFGMISFHMSFVSNKD